MFLYTVYPITSAPRKQAARRVQPVSRAKAVGIVVPVQNIRHDIVTPPHQAYGPQEVTHRQSRVSDQASEIVGFQITGEQDSREQPTGELYIQNIQPLLLLWRHPKTVIADDFIEKHRDRLHAVQVRHDRGGRTRHRHISTDKNGVLRQ